MDTVFFGSPLVVRSTDSQALYVNGGLRVLQSAVFGANVKVPLFSTRRRKFTDTFTVGQAASNVYYNSFLRPSIASQASGVRTNEAATVYIQGPPQGTARNSIQTTAALVVSQGPSQFRDDVSVSGGVSVSRRVFAINMTTGQLRTSTLNTAVFRAPQGLSVTSGTLRGTSTARTINMTQAGLIGTLNVTSLVMTNDTTVNETMTHLTSNAMTVPVIRASTVPALLQVTAVHSLSVNNASSANPSTIGANETNAGTMTVRGHAAIAKLAYANNVNISQTSGVQTNYMTIRFNQTAQTVLLNASGVAGGTIYNDSHMNFVSAGPARLQTTEALLFNFTPTVSVVARVRLAALGLGHGGDAVQFGGTGNTEYLNIATGTNTFEIRAVRTGTGTDRSLALGTQDYPRQISLETAGNYVVMTQGALVASTVLVGSATSLQGSTGTLFLSYTRGISFLQDQGINRGLIGIQPDDTSRHLIFLNTGSRGLFLESRNVYVQSLNTAAKTDQSLAINTLPGYRSSPYERLTLGSNGTAQFLISPTNAGTSVLRPLTLGFSGTSMFLQTNGGVELLTGSARGSLALAGTSDPTVNLAGGLAVARAVLAASCTASGRIVSAPLGSLAQTSAFTINNNQTAAAIVSGLSFPSSVRSAVLQIAITINATTPLYTLQRLFLVNKQTSWDVTTESTGSTSGVAFTVGATNGQVSYTSGNYGGFTSGNLRYSAIAV